MKTSGQIGEFYGFQMSAEFDSFNQKYMVTLKRQCSYKVEIGKDALGNLQRISNALSGIEKKAAETQQKLETLQQQLETAKEEVAKPFEREHGAGGEVGASGRVKFPSEHGRERPSRKRLGQRTGQWRQTRPGSPGK